MGATDQMGVMPPGRRALTTVVVMAAMIMVVLDATIANVALPHMRAALGANQETVSWVLTSYILASAVATPVTGWLSDRFGRRALFTVAVAGFTVSSMLCGIATTLPTMVAARVLQGVFGAFIAPVSQAVLYDINPPEKHASAMTVWGIGVMAAPVIGPMLGGYLTDALDWRWVFFVNVPIGIAAGLGSWALLPPGRGARRRLDVIGFLLLALSLSAFQLMLDRGTQNDWFDAVETWVEAGLSLSALWMFAVWTVATPDPLVPKALFRDRTYMTALVLITLLGGIMMAGAVLVAPMLQQLMGYPVFDAGLLIAPRGIGTMAGMMLAGRVVRRVDARILIAGGLAIVALSLWMQTGFDLQMGARPVVTSGLVQGFGIGLVFIPLNLLAFATLAPALRTEAAAIYSLMRSIGGAIAISATTALLATNAQTSHGDLGANLSTVTMPFVEAGLAERMGLPSESILQFLDLEVNRQALMIAYLDDYWVMMWAALLVVPLVLLLRRPPRGAAAPPPPIE